MKNHVKGENSKGVSEVEDNSEAKKKKKRDKKSKHLNGVPKTKNLYEQYTQMETKGNVNNTLLKSGAEVLASGALAPYLSASLGTKAPLLGIALILTGNYLDDKTTLLKTVGAGILAHSVAKVKEYNTQTDKGFKDRIAGVTDDLLHVMLIRKYDKTTITSASSVKQESSNPETSIVKQETELIREEESTLSNIPINPIMSSNSINQKGHDDDPFDLNELDFESFLKKTIGA